LRELTCFPLPEGQYWKSSPYGYRIHPITGKRTLHRGVDYAAQTSTDVYAPFDGFVTTGFQVGGAGNWTNVQAGPDVFKSFHHSAVVVAHGPVVSGQVIARIGTTGSSTGPHAHLELWENGNCIDPTAYLDRAPLKGSAPAPIINPIPAEDEDVREIYWTTGGAAFAVINGMHKRGCANEGEYNHWLALGYVDRGTNDTVIGMALEMPKGA
jgi:hypothetical protein